MEPVHEGNSSTEGRERTGSAGVLEWNSLLQQWVLGAIEVPGVLHVPWGHQRELEFQLELEEDQKFRTCGKCQILGHLAKGQLH